MKQAFFMADPWKWEVGIFHGGTGREFAALVKRLADADVGEISGAQGYCFIEDGKPVMVWVHSLADVPTLVHELIHATFGLMRLRGMTYSADGEEAYTYTLEALLRHILNQRKWMKA